MVKQEWPKYIMALWWPTGAYWNLQYSDPRSNHSKLETKDFVIYTGHIDNQEWETIFTYLTLPSFILGSDEVQF